MFRSFQTGSSICFIAVFLRKIFIAKIFPEEKLLCISKPGIASGAVGAFLMPDLRFSPQYDLSYGDHSVHNAFIKAVDKTDVSAPAGVPSPYNIVFILVKLYIIQATEFIL